MFKLLLQCLDTLAEVFSVGLVVQLRLQASGFLLLELPLQSPETKGQRAVILLCLPLQVQPILGQTISLCQQSLKNKKGNSSQ